MTAFNSHTGSLSILKNKIRASQGFLEEVRYSDFEKNDLFPILSKAGCSRQEAPRESVAKKEAGA